MNTDYELLDSAPDLETYLELRRISGLTPRTAEQGAPALTNSWAWVTVRHRASGDVVAMGRVIGDGGWYFMVADMATSPEHQRQGLGRAILTRLLARIEHDAPSGAYVTLMADAPGRPLYESLGFVQTAPRSVGMRLERRRPQPSDNSST